MSLLSAVDTTTLLQRIWCWSATENTLIPTYGCLMKTCSRKPKQLRKMPGPGFPSMCVSLLESSDVVIWLTQFENPKSAPSELGATVCSYWDQVYEALKGKPLLSVNLLSAKSLETMDIDYEESLTTFANAVNVDYHKVKQTGSALLKSLHKKQSIKITTPDGTDLTFSIKSRRVGIEDGTLEECLSKGKECDVEIPAGEVYVAPVENSAHGMLVTDEVRDFDVQKLRMKFHKGRITSFEAEKGKASFKRLLDEAHGHKDRIAEFGIGINYGMKPIGLRIYDEKAQGTAHVAIGNNTHLGGINKASIHIDFIMHKPTIKADNDLIMKDGKAICKPMREDR